MLTYKYKAKSKNGADVDGYVEAINEFDAVSKIKETCSVVTEIKEVKQKNQITFERRIKEKDLSIMCSQFSIILGAGLPIVSAVDLIAKQTEFKPLKKILTAVAGDVGDGHPLAKSFEDEGPKLPATFIETIRSGEESGTLEASFERLHKYYDKSSKIANKIKSAMIYPIFTIVVAIIVVIIIMVVAVPIFTESFDALGTDLPGLTKALIATSNFFTHWWWLMIIIMASCGIMYKLYRKREDGRLKTDKMKLKNPILGRLTRMKTASQFANTMSTLISAGLPIMEAVNITGKVIDNYYVGSQIINAVPQLEQGRTLGNALQNCEYLPELLIEMTAVGEETGTLESTLDTIGTFYDNESDLAATKMLALLEPIIICVLAFIVLFILLSVYMPMFTMYGSM